MPTEITRLLSRGLHWSEPASFAWVAGLIEGEGCITTQRGYPVVEVAMTDRDVITRFTEIVGTSLWGPYPRRGQWKSIWKTRVTGEERLTDLYSHIEPFLGERRRARFQELLGGDADHPVFRWQVGGPNECSLIATRLRPWLGQRRRAKLSELTSGRFVVGLSQALYLEEQFWESEAAEPKDLKTPGQGTFPQEPRPD